MHVIWNSAISEGITISFSADHTIGVEIDDLVVIAGIVFTIVITFIAFILLWRSPRSYTRDLALLIMGLSNGESIIFLIVCTGIGDTASMALVLVATISEYWVVAFVFQMVKSFSKWRHIGAKGIPQLIVYLPIIALTILLGVAYAAMPSSFNMGSEMGLHSVDPGLLAPFLSIVGGIYIIASLSITLAVIVGEDKTIRHDASMLLVVLVILAVYYPILELMKVHISSLAVSLVIASLFGLILADATLKKRPIIVPQREDSPKEGKDDKTEFGHLLFRGNTYIFMGKRQEEAHTTFADMVSGGSCQFRNQGARFSGIYSSEGLWVTRRPPAKARKEYGLVKTPFIWLTAAEIDGEVCIAPENSGRLSKALTDFMAAAKNFIILLEGMEYISSKLGPKTTLTLVQFLNDKVMTARGILIIALDPAAFAPADIALLSSEAAKVFRDEEGWDDEKTAAESAVSGRRPSSNGQRATQKGL